MKTLLLRGALGGLLAVPVLLSAQWKTETYALRGGWNAIYLHGDASHTTPAELFKDNPGVLEVWRWNPNPDQVQFTDSPAVPSATSSEWTIWSRNDPDEQTLTAMVGQAAYLVRVDGAAATTLSVSIPQRPRPPAATWLITGANLLGFPADSAAPPLASAYLASFPVATAPPGKIYKYTGGDLGPANPIEVSASSERLARNTAYWFEAATVGNFTAPVEYELPSVEGLAFGRAGSAITVGVMNRSTSALTLTLSTEPSEPAPAGQTAITGAVPLTRRVFDSATGTTKEEPVTGAFTVTVPASGRLNLEFGVDRTQLTGSASALYGSFLRIKDSARLSDVWLPVSAQTATPAGLWVGQVDVTTVNSTVAGSPGNTTARSFPLRVILHVDAAGVARLLSQAHVGTLADAGQLPGIALRESALLSSRKADALRLVASHLPLDRAHIGTGAFAVGSSLAYSVTIPFDDPTNPFAHAYHPDHDNRDARLAALPAGVESYTVTRALTFTFTSAPPDGTKILGWGASIYGGTYRETLTGIHKSPLTVGGTFTLRRLSEIADITLN